MKIMIILMENVELKLIVNGLIKDNKDKITLNVLDVNQIIQKNVM